MNVETTYAKCHCYLCGGSIEFPSEGDGQRVNCPHCGRETVLVIRNGDHPLSEELSVPTVSTPAKPSFDDLTIHDFTPRL